MLAWRDVNEAGASALDGYNVVVHEFAHVVDMRAGLTASLVRPGNGRCPTEWSAALREEYEQFSAMVERDEDTFLDPYGAQAPEEFFAVASEAFFVAPRRLAAEQAGLYALLKKVFGQDPAAALA